MANLTSQLSGDSQLTVFLSMEDEAIYRSLKHLWMSDKPQMQATAKAAWITFSINICLNCY